MEKRKIEQLKYDLKKAVEEKNITKIKEISNMLNIPEEQQKYFEQGLTGYPSVDRVWLKKYAPDMEAKVNDIPKNKTIWDVIEEKILEYYEIPALEYFGRTFSRQEFKDLCYVWARTFRAMGVEKDEIVPVYGPFVPDVCAMLFGLNMIGACPYFLKLAITPEALAEETKEAKIAVVFDGMWQYVAHEFSKDKYKNVIIASATADMPFLKKQVASFMSKIQEAKKKSGIPDEKKYIWADKAKKIANYHTGEVKVPFEKNRNAVITSSSGSTIGGLVKGVIATNESVLSQIYSTSYSDILYEPGFRTLNHFPPTAATSLNALFLIALYNGATVLIDPRTSEQDFYNQLTQLKPNICLNTGTMWTTFFNRLKKEIKEGKKFDLSYAKGWMSGGEDIPAKRVKEWDEIMEMCGGGYIYGGYGLSETFSGLSYDRVDRKPTFTKPMSSSGLIQVGMIAGVFDKDGNELSYNQRGEFRVKTNTAMKGYYNKPELTKTTIKDGWIKTSDLAEIDEEGYLYVWGRMSDSIKLNNNQSVYLFDIANKIKESKAIDDALVLKMPTEANENNLVAHIVWASDVTEDSKKQYLEELNEALYAAFPEVTVSAYSEHPIMLPYSPTTLKKDRNKLSKQTSGYVQVIDGKINNIEYALNESGKYSQIDQGNVKTLVRK